MKDLQFITKKTGKHFEYHLPVNYNSFAFKSLFDTLYKGDKDYTDELGPFLWENGITGICGFREYTTLYFLILNAFSKNNSSYLVYFDSKKAIGQVQNTPDPEQCEWKFSIEFCEGMETCNSFGFLNPSEFLEAVNYSDKNLDNRYYYILQLQKSNLIKFMKLYGSDVTNFFFVFTGEEKEDKLKGILKNKSVRPQLKELLGLSKCIINLQVGGDEGYLDYVLIQSAKDMNTEIGELENNFKKFIEAYEKLLDETGKIDEEWKIEFYKETFQEIIKQCT